MRQSDCYQLGEVIKTHGLNGEVNVYLDVDFPDEYQNLESVFLEQQGKLIPFFIESIQISNKKALVQFEDINSIETAKPLIKSKIFLPLSQLPKLKDDQYYFHDLIECEVYEDSKKLGLIKKVIDLSGNQLLSVHLENKEILIPLKDEILINVDIPNKKVIVKLPEGLLDIYNE